MQLDVCMSPLKHKDGVGGSIQQEEKQKSVKHKTLTEAINILVFYLELHVWP